MKIIEIKMLVFWGFNLKKIFKKRLEIGLKSSILTMWGWESPAKKTETKRIER